MMADHTPAPFDLQTGPRAEPFCDVCRDVGCDSCFGGNAPDLDPYWYLQRYPEAPQLSMWDLMCL